MLYGLFEVANQKGRTNKRHRHIQKKIWSKWLTHKIFLLGSERGNYDKSSNGNNHIADNNKLFNSNIKSGEQQPKKSQDDNLLE